MSATMSVEVVSPEAVLYSGEATMVITRTLGGGEIAFQPGHAAFLGALTKHTRVFLADTQLNIAVHGGFVEVSNSKVSILSDAAEIPLRSTSSRQRRQKIRRNRSCVENMTQVRLQLLGGQTLVSTPPAFRCNRSPELLDFRTLWQASINHRSDRDRITRLCVLASPVEANASEELTIGQSCGGEEAVVALNEIILAEHPTRVDAGSLDVRSFII